ncbi:sucrose synthase [Trifolium repens]|nr:sucrose synthase [Trifolium repens]
MLLCIKQQGLDIVPRLLIITRLLPDAVGTTCGQRLEKVYGTKHCHILRVPFSDSKGFVRKWISRFKVWPYLKTYIEDVLMSFAKVLHGKPDQ